MQAGVMSADEAGSQPCRHWWVQLRHGHLLAALSVRHRTRTGTVRPDISAVPSLRKKLRVHQGPEQRIADVALQAPESLGLRRCQSKPRHFYILTLDPLKHVVDTHGPPRENIEQIV
jgi:hypothetical protein